MRKYLRIVYWFLRETAPFRWHFRFISDPLKTRINMLRNRGKTSRKLEIGCAGLRIEGLETLSIEGGPRIDYVMDASKRLPFASESFDLVYACHILEHIPWYHTENVIAEWSRILKPGGILEVHVPDGLKICRAFVRAEEENAEDYLEDGWFKFNPNRDPCVWAGGRLYAYGDGAGNTNHPNWHRALFTARYLEHIFAQSGLDNASIVPESPMQRAQHGWIDLGIRGRKRQREGG